MSSDGFYRLNASGYRLALDRNCRERLAVHNDRRRARSSGLSNPGGNNPQGASQFLTEAANTGYDQARLARMRHTWPRVPAHTPLHAATACSSAGLWCWRVVAARSGPETRQGM